MDKKKVLIVDDDESIREYLEKALVLEQYAVTTAGSAAEALGVLKANPGGFPVVLSDIMMPGIDGMELLNFVKKEYPETIVIMLTANATMETAIKSLNIGAFGYLMKPVVLEELKGMLKNAYNKYNLTKENQRLMQELKEEKEFTETIVKNLVYTVVATDSEGCIKKINKAMENLLGYTEQELVKVPIQSIFSKEFKLTSWDELMKQNQVREYPMVLLTKDGRDIKVLFSGTIMKNTQGDIIGFLGTTSL
ncbi:MAG: response regulator [Elusimicrobiota bacterium]